MLSKLIKCSGLVTYSFFHKFDDTKFKKNKKKQKNLRQCGQHLSWEMTGGSRLGHSVASRHQLESIHDEIPLIHWQSQHASPLTDVQLSPWALVESRKWQLAEMINDGSHKTKKRNRLGVRNWKFFSLGDTEKIWQYLEADRQFWKKQPHTWVWQVSSWLEFLKLLFKIICHRLNWIYIARFQWKVFTLSYIGMTIVLHKTDKGQQKSGRSYSQGWELSDSFTHEIMHMLLNMANLVVPWLKIILPMPLGWEKFVSTITLAFSFMSHCYSAIITFGLIQFT